MLQQYFRKLLSELKADISHSGFTSVRKEEGKENKPALENPSKARVEFCFTQQSIKIAIRHCFQFLLGLRTKYQADRKKR